MRFLLINPFYPISENPSPPLGLAYLAAVLERAGVDVRIADYVVFPYSADELAREMDRFRPDAVGATAVTMSFDAAVEALRDVKRIAPEVPTIMGGPHVSFRAEKTLLEHPEVDYIVLGEGEETLLEWVEAFERGDGYDRVRGLAFRDGVEVVRTPPRRPGVDLDRLPPPARHLLPLGRYRALGLAISMTTSRGCPHGCIFCVGRKMVGARVRYHNPVDVVDELERVAALGFHQINIADDLFTADPKHCLAVCDEIVRRGLEVTWTSFARVDTVFEPVLFRMRQAGCSAVSFGVETGSPEILKTIRKGITLDQVMAAVDMCNRAGITPHASFILGLPGETPDTLRQTLDFGLRLKSLGVSYGFHLLAPFPGTRVRENADEYGLRILTDDWGQYHANRAVAATDAVSGEELNRIAAEWEREFDEYLGELQERLEQGLASEEEARPLVNLIRTVLVYDLMMGRWIETLGAWPVAEDPGDPAGSLRLLADRVVPRVKNNLAEVIDTLENAHRRGHLIRTVSPDGVRWAWNDGLGETGPADRPSRAAEGAAG